jgi:hypothetical protein
MVKAATELAAVSAARTAYNARAAAIDAEAKLKKELAKASVLDAIKTALQAGATMNAVSSQGLGYANITGMRHFLGASGTRAEDMLAALGEQLERTQLPTPAGFVKYEFRKDGTASHDLFYVDDAAGKKQKVYGTLFDGIVKFPDTEDREAIVRAFKARFGDKYKYSEEDSAL